MAATVEAGSEVSLIMSDPVRRVPLRVQHRGQVMDGRDGRLLARQRNMVGLMVEIK